MKEIVVNDTNLLIDMHSAGLLEYIRSSGVRFHTVDYVIEELRRSPYRRPLIEDLWVVDMFVAEGIITPGEMILKLNTLLSANRRLPKKLIEDKIQQLDALASGSD